MEKKYNIVIFVVSITLCLINRKIQGIITLYPLHFFLTCYFNDVVGAIGFVAYCNVLLNIFNKSIKKALHIELLMLLCGLFWEYITPLFRNDTTSDILDIVAYMCGGIIYWFVIKINTKNVYK